METMPSTLSFSTTGRCVRDGRYEGEREIDLTRTGGTVTSGAPITSRTIVSRDTPDQQRHLPGVVALGEHPHRACRRP
jgi:hypothetical protein